MQKPRLVDSTTRHKLRIGQIASNVGLLTTTGLMKIVDRLAFLVWLSIAASQMAVFLQDKVLETRRHGYICTNGYSHKALNQKQTSH